MSLLRGWTYCAALPPLIVLAGREPSLPADNVVHVFGDGGGGANNGISSSNGGIEAAMLTLRYISSPQLCVAGSLATSHETCEPLARVGTISEGGGVGKRRPVALQLVPPA